MLLARVIKWQLAYKSGATCVSKWGSKPEQVRQHAGVSGQQAWVCRAASQLLCDEESKEQRLEGSQERKICNKLTADIGMQGPANARSSF